MEQDDLSRFEDDIQALADTLKQRFNSDKVRWFLHEQTETLYLEISGLESVSDDEIERLAGPILEEQDLDFEEIVLLPLK